MTRTERQRLCVKKWIAAKGKGTIVGATGFGKTRVGLTTFKALLKKYPTLRILVVVPTTGLKDQWQSLVDEWGFTFNVEIQVINTVIEHNWTCDLLTIDECHRMNSDTFRQIFNKVKYKLILGLTATFERLDGKHVIMQKYCPIIDDIPLVECLANGWVSEYKEYKVLLEVEDIDYYKQLNREFIKYFEFFDFDFSKAKKCCGKDGWKYKLELVNEMYKGKDESKRKDILKAITVNSIGFMRVIQKRKAFINNHPKKIEITRKILEARKDKKIITFSNNIKMAEAIENGNNVYSGKVSKKKGRIMIEDFNAQTAGNIHTIRKADEGLDIPGLSVAIILGTDSSETKARQRKGRAIRKEGNKVAEVFYLIIKDTVEEKWHDNSHRRDKDFITIDEENLEKVLRHEEPEEYKKKTQQLLFRW